MCGPRPRHFFRQRGATWRYTGKKDDKSWFDDTEPEDVKFLRETLVKMRSAIKNGLSFDEAAGMISFPDAETKDAALDDILKVLIGEMHFNGGKPLEELSKTLRVPMPLLNKARAEMMIDVKAAAVEAYYDSIGKKGNA